MGAPEELVKEFEAKAQRDEFEVLEENWKTVLMFLRLQTQWTYSGMGEVIGLNYQSLEFLFKVHEVEDPKTMLEDLNTMEIAVLSAVRSKNEKEVST